MMLTPTAILGPATKALDFEVVRACCWRLAFPPRSSSRGFPSPTPCFMLPFPQFPLMISVCSIVCYPRRCSRLLVLTRSRLPRGSAGVSAANLNGSVLDRPGDTNWVVDKGTGKELPLIQASCVHISEA